MAAAARDVCFFKPLYPTTHQPPNKDQVIVFLQLTNNTKII
jgi:hypothetical protein